MKETWNENAHPQYSQAASETPCIAGKRNLWIYIRIDVRRQPENLQAFLWVEVKSQLGPASDNGHDYISVKSDR